MSNYQRLSCLITAYDKKNHCELCYAPYKVYKGKFQNTKVCCVLNDNRAVVLYFKNSPPIRLLYQDIKRIEKRGCRQLVLVLRDNEIVINSYKRKSMFNHLRHCLLSQ